MHCPAPAEILPEKCSWGSPGWTGRGQEPEGKENQKGKEKNQKVKESQKVKEKSQKVKENQR